jgi:hypothetical protein
MDQEYKDLQNEDMELEQSNKYPDDLYDDNEENSTSDQLDALREEKNKLLGIGLNGVMSMSGRQLVKFNPRINGFAGPLILGMITAIAGVIFMYMVK